MVLSGFLHHYNWSHWYRWNNVESGVKTPKIKSNQILLYKIIHGEAAVNITDYIMRPSVLTRLYHQDRSSRVSTSTDAYKYSFIPRTIKDWNRLPQGIIQAPSTDVFRAGVWEYLLQCGNLFFFTCRVLFVCLILTVNIPIAQAGWHICEMDVPTADYPRRSRSRR